LTLGNGSRLGPYEILSPLGAGGMGEVYRARDTRLERMVAIKVLSKHLSISPDGRQRFEREAKTISQLSHPHICALHDVGREGDLEYLVMELLDGDTLSERLTKGALPLEQTLRYGSQIADALDTAHRQGIVHRDLKPGNVMLTKTGVKLLDFGLAKAVAGGENTALTTSPTQANLTEKGTVLGTFQYMAPEQLEGKEVEGRSDIFALGVVLYEMATGKKAFTGSTQASLISAILRDEPPPISQVHPMAPPALDHVVKTCLAKDANDRWQSAGDVAKELRWIAEGSQAGAAAAPAIGRRGRREAVAWAAAGLLALGALFLVNELRRARRSPPRTVHSVLAPPENTVFRMTGDDGAPIVLSPDGRRAVFGSGGRLWVQSLETGAAVALPSKSGGKFPFWSADSRSIGFFTDGKLKTADTSGGPVQDICDAPNPRGGAWNSEGVIIFAPDILTGLFRVPASGGQPTPLTVPDGSKHTTHRWPEFLADSRHFIYLAANHNVPESEETGIYLSELDGKGSRRLFPSEGNGQWVPGWILSVRETTLIARPFDDRSFALGGEAIRAATNVHLDKGVWRGVFSASHTGLLAYQIAPSQGGTQLTWFDRSGKALEQVGERSAVYWPRLSPDGRRVAVAQGDPNSDIWVYETGRGTRIRLTAKANITGPAAWSPDGSRIVYVSRLPSGFVLFIVPSNGSSEVREMATVSERIEPTDWSPDGRFILYGLGNIGASDIWALPVADPSKAFPLVRSPFVEASGQFSPDGRWVAYTSLESGRNEVYVTPFPAGGARWQVSTAGGNLPRWRGDGRELYFLSPDEVLMAATVTPGKDRFEVQTVVPLFRTNLSVSPRTDQYPYDVTADGNRFLVTASGDPEPPRVALVVSWDSVLARAN
jgi:eukaryotic-like serine/threonine-protein kinase